MKILNPVISVYGIIPVIVCVLSHHIWAAPIRNVVLCIGDGMGPEHVKAARCYSGTNLFFESFPFQSTMTTWSANSPITDSAASGTAMATGCKVNNDVISIQIPGDGRELETLLEHFKVRGKASGLVVTAYISDATPATFGAHESSRLNHINIAKDYLNDSRPNVLFGGGGHGMTAGAAVAAGYTVVTNRAELLALDAERETFVSGQFGITHFPYEFDGIGNLPHLHEMTQVALNILDNDPNGFFLMVEGSRIDHAGHEHDIMREIHETLEFDKSVETVAAWMEGREDTLLLVTADHETGGLTVTNDNGVGYYPDVSWSTTWHTAAPVPVYGMGVNASLVTNVADNTDIHALATSATTGPEVCIATGMDTNGFHMTWTSLSNTLYRVESKAGLAGGSWEAFATVTATNSLLLFTDTNRVHSTRFYRLIQE